jgi:hypothetical protein
MPRQTLAEYIQMVEHIDQLNEQSQESYAEKRNELALYGGESDMSYTVKPTPPWFKNLNLLTVLQDGDNDKPSIIDDILF